MKDYFEIIALIISFVTTLSAMYQVRFSIKSFRQSRNDEVVKFRYEKIYEFYIQYIAGFSELDSKSPDETVLYSRSQYDSVKFLLDEEYLLTKEYNELTEYILEYVKTRKITNISNFTDAAINFDKKLKEHLQQQLTKLYKSLNGRKL